MNDPRKSFQIRISGIPIAVDGKQRAVVENTGEDLDLLYPGLEQDNSTSLKLSFSSEKQDVILITCSVIEMN